MAVKAILLLIMVVHTCSDAFNVIVAHVCTAVKDSSERNLAVTAETDWPIENISHPDEVFWYGNSSGNNPYDLPPGLDLSNIIAIIPEIWRDDYQNAYACNSTELGEVKCNQTTAHLGTFNISDEDVLFLKGLLVAHIMPSFYILVLLISMPLNTLALVTFTCRIRAKKPAVIYMSHLACVDLLFTLLLPLKIHYHLNGIDWVFGEVTCRVFSAAYYCYMYCSILLMMCMSVDRLVAVAFPITSLSWRSTRNATCICTLVWLLALAGTVPLLSVRQTFKIENVGITCHDVLQHTQLYVYHFSILSCLYFFLPLVFTLASYSTIIYVLNVKPDHLATSLSSSGTRKRAVIMVIAVLTEFVVCFAPTNGILLYHCVRLATGGHTEEGKYYMLAVCAGSSSVFLDPLLYYYGSSQCRQQISSVFWWRKTKSPPTLSNTRSQSKSSHLSCEYSQARMKV